MKAQVQYLGLEAPRKSGIVAMQAKGIREPSPNILMSPHVTAVVSLWGHSCALKAAYAFLWKAASERGKGGQFQRLLRSVFPLVSLFLSGGNSA